MIKFTGGMSIHSLEINQDAGLHFDGQTVYEIQMNENGQPLILPDDWKLGI